MCGYVFLMSLSVFPSFECVGTLMQAVTSTGASVLMKNTKQQQSKWSKVLNCPFCFKSFYQKIDLQRHIRVHTGEKPFECGICKRRFKRKESLTYHIASCHE